MANLRNDPKAKNFKQLNFWEDSDLNNQPSANECTQVYVAGKIMKFSVIDALFLSNIKCLIFLSIYSQMLKTGGEVTFILDFQNLNGNRGGGGGFIEDDLLVAYNIA